MTMLSLGVQCLQHLATMSCWLCSFRSHIARRRASHINTWRQSAVHAWNFIRSPCTVVPGGLMFYCCFFFVSTRYFRDLSADRRETLPRDRKCVKFYNTNPKFPRGVLPQNVWPKTWRIWSDFGRDFRLRSWMRISLQKMGIFKIRKLIDR